MNVRTLLPLCHPQPSQSWPSTFLAWVGDHRFPLVRTPVCFRSPLFSFFPRSMSSPWPPFRLRIRSTHRTAPRVPLDSRTAPAYVVSPSVRNRRRPAWGWALACSSAQNLHTHSVGRGLAISASPGALVETPSPRPHQTLGKTARQAHPPSTRHTSLLPFRSCLCHLSERPSQTTPSKMPPYSGSLFLFFTYLFTFKFISFSRNSFIFYNDMDKKYRVPMYPFIAPIPNFPYY